MTPDIIPASGVWGAFASHGIHSSAGIAYAVNFHCLFLGKDAQENGFWGLGAPVSPKSAESHYSGHGTKDTVTDQYSEHLWSREGVKDVTYVNVKGNDDAIYLSGAFWNCTHPWQWCVLLLALDLVLNWHRPSTGTLYSLGAVNMIYGTFMAPGAATGVAILSFLHLAQTIMIRGRLQTCMLISGYFAYLVAGAIVFQVLEQEVEVKSQDRLSQLKEDFLKNFTSLSPAEVENFVQNLIEAIRMGIYPTGNEHPTKHSNWNFGNSFFFVGSMLATIGYGNQVPKTASGQLFCVVYALFGIPLNIVFLHHIGKILSLLCERLIKYLHQKGILKEGTRFLTLMFFLLMGIIAFLCVPAIIFRKMEGWTYSEAIYFTFITLSTIGFGDYVIGRQHDKNYFPCYRILVAIWIIFGLAWIALLFNLLTALLEDPKKEDKHFLQVKSDIRNETNRGPSDRLSLENDTLLHPVKTGIGNETNTDGCPSAGLPREDVPGLPLHPVGETQKDQL